MIARYTPILVAALAASALAGCGGGGSGGASAPVPVPSPTTAPLTTASLTITVPQAAASPIPLRGAAGAARSPRYVSPGTTNVQIFVNGATTPSVNVALPAGTPGSGATTYPLSLPVPIGADTFLVNLASTSGALLATGSATVTISYAGPNNVPITANGIPVAARIAPTSFAPPVGAAAFPLGITAYDAAGYPIAGTFVTASGTPSPFSLAVTGATLVTTGTGTTPPTNGGLALALTGSADASAAALTFGTGTAPVRVALARADGRLLGAAVFRPGALSVGKTAYVITGGTDNLLYRIDTSTYAVQIVPVVPAANPTAVKVSPDGRALLLGMANGNTAVYDTTAFGLLATLKPQGTSTAPSVVDLAIDDLSQNLYELLALGNGSFAVDRIGVASGAGSRALLAGATGCTSIAVDLAGTTVAASCASGVSSVSFAGGGAATAPTTVPGGGNVVQQFLAPFNVIASNGSGTATFFSVTALGGSVLYTPGTALAVPAGSPALALSPTSQVLYAGTATGVQVRDISASAPTPLLGTIALPSAPLQIVDIPGGYVLPDAQIWTVEQNGKVQALDAVAFGILHTTTLPGPAIGLAFGP